MKTRQSSRKKINLPGRYISGSGELQDVVLRDLSPSGCRFDLGLRRLTPGSPLQMYVAGTGPHRGIVKWVAGGEAGLGFLAPLPESQFGRFQSSHIPDPADRNIGVGPDDIGQIKPQRFC
jgi:hypothetical protein